MSKHYEISGRVEISGDPMKDAELLAQFRSEYDAFLEKFTEAGGTLGVRIVTVRGKASAVRVVGAKAAE